jgi:hypothetical protein
MRFQCPQCAQHRITLTSRACPDCGFPLSLRSILGFYWQRLVERLRQTAVTPCPHCARPIPINAKRCPKCGDPVTVNAAVKAVTGPTQQRLFHFLNHKTPEQEQRFQWGYLGVSFLVLWGMVAYVSHYGTGSNWLWGVALSVGYLAVFFCLGAWLIPRSVWTRLRKFSRIIKLAFVFNFLTLLMVLQLVISALLGQAMVLMMLFGVTVIAVVTYSRRLWPLKKEIEESNEQPFDPLKPQGRKGRWE